MPANVTKIVASPTRKTLRADQRMSAGDHGCVSCWPKLCSAALQIALGVDEEVRRGDDFLALLQTIRNLGIAVAAATELHRAGLEAALTLWRRAPPACVPLSITALSGTAVTGASVARAWKTTSAYIEVFSRRSGWAAQCAPARCASPA